VHEDPGDTVRYADSCDRLVERPFTDAGIFAELDWVTHVIWPGPQLNRATRLEG
jgi:hypothetical protein